MFKQSDDDPEEIPDNAEVSYSRRESRTPLSSPWYYPPASSEDARYNARRSPSEQESRPYPSIRKWSPNE